MRRNPGARCGDGRKVGPVQHQSFSGGYRLRVGPLPILERCKPELARRAFAGLDPGHRDLTRGQSGQERQPAAKLRGVPQGRKIRLVKALRTQYADEQDRCGQEGELHCC